MTERSCQWRPNPPSVRSSLACRTTRRSRQVQRALGRWIDPSVFSTHHSHRTAGPGSFGGCSRHRTAVRRPEAWVSSSCALRLDKGTAARVRADFMRPLQALLLPRQERCVGQQVASHAGIADVHMRCDSLDPTTGGSVCVRLRVPALPCSLLLGQNICNIVVIGRPAPCLHLLFIMLKVLRCPRDSPLLW